MRLTRHQNENVFLGWYYRICIQSRINSGVLLVILKLAFFNLNKLGRFVKVHKNVLPKGSNKNVMYKIDCNATYVGQTDRKLKTRIQEHRRQINSSNGTRLVITDHRLSLNHDFNWENVKILDRERYLRRRLVSETLYIQI